MSIIRSLIIDSRPNTPESLTENALKLDIIYSFGTHEHELARLRNAVKYKDIFLLLMNTFIS